MKKIKFLALCAMVAGVVTSCQKDEISNDTQPNSLELSKELRAKILNTGVNPDNAKIETITSKLDGTSQKFLIVDDIMMPFDQFEAGEFDLGVAEDGEHRQYRTNNLVTGGNRSFRVVGYTGSCCALTSKMRTALQWAVNNYNRLNTSLNLSLVFQANFNNSDMVVYNNGAGGGGGSAGFPSGGQVFKRVQINAGTNSFSTNVVEHVITHEIGHSVGFRHQDWRTRQSCGQNTNEGPAGVGAILINGTPSSDRADSVMLACFSSGEDGEFTSSDINALNALY